MVASMPVFLSGKLLTVCHNAISDLQTVGCVTDIFPGRSITRDRQSLTYLVK